MFTPAAWGSIFGLKPWADVSYFYSLMAILLSALIAFTVASEFYRGGRVISEKTGQGIFASMVQLTHRNTRRYGGYIVHFGIVLVMIGFSGAALNQDKEMEMGYGDKMTIGNYDLVCRSYTQDENANQFTEWAMMEVYQGGKLIRTMSPQRIFYKASQQASTKPDIHQSFKEDLYLVYEGQDDKGQPIIKAHVNPMVMWIWIGAWVMILGTALALIEPAPAPVTVKVPRLAEPAASVAGD
jgi:cytochrome c-type biogenesis protein CcmF